jgi:3-oxoacyl-[acyl-carrier protein] reductase
MNRGLDDKVAIITGAAHGLGRAYALRLASHGAAVVVADIDGHGCQAVVAEIEEAGGRAFGVGVDIRDAEGLTVMSDQTVSAFGGIDILVNNAAIFLTVGMSRVGFDQLTEEEWDRMMAVNVRGTWLACKAVVPHMRKRGYGKIVNVSSDTALKGSPRRIHYVASKSAILGFTRTLAAELGPDGIRVNAIAPGIVLSEEEPTEQRREQAVSSQILSEPLFPGDLAETVVFLSSPASDPITGQILAVNGGGYM